MKIIVSPSKTQTNIIQLEGLDHPKYHSESRQIIKELKQYRKEELASIMKIKGQLLDQTYHDIKNLKLNQTSLTPAIRLYTGVVYDALKLDDYTVEEKLYLNQNVRIISALYGVLSPMDGSDQSNVQVSTVEPSTALDTSTPVKVLINHGGAGVSSFSVSNMTVSLDIPANAYAGTYKTDATIALTAGP